MSKKSLVGAMLATSVALSALVGCQVPSPAGPGAAQPGANATAAKPGAVAAKPGAAPATSKTEAGAQNSTEVASALSEEREAEDYNAIAEEEGAARYNVFVVGAPKPEEGMMGITATGGAQAEAPKPTAGKPDGKGDGPKAGGKGGMLKKLGEAVKKQLDERKAKLKAKGKARVEKMADARANIKAALGKAAWVDNGDGTKTKTIEFERTKTTNGKTVSKKVKIVRIVDSEDNSLISMNAEFSHTAPNGASHTMTRSKTLQEDGSYKVVFHSEIKQKDGATRTADWTKTIGADGKVTGTGTIVWKAADGTVKKEVKVTLGGSEEAEQAKAEDAATGTTAEVTVPAEGQATAEVKDAAGTTTPVTLPESEDGTIASTAEAEASADASATAAASPTPAPSATPAP